MPGGIPCQHPAVGANSRPWARPASRRGRFSRLADNRGGRELAAPRLRCSAPTTACGSSASRADRAPAGATGPPCRIALAVKLDLLGQPGNGQGGEAALGLFALADTGIAWQHQLAGCARPASPAGAFQLGGIAGGGRPTAGAPGITALITVANRPERSAAMPLAIARRRECLRHQRPRSSSPTGWRRLVFAGIDRRVAPLFALVRAGLRRQRRRWSSCHVLQGMRRRPSATLFSRRDQAAAWGRPAPLLNSADRTGLRLTSCRQSLSGSRPGRGISPTPACCRYLPLSELAQALAGSIWQTFPAQPGGAAGWADWGRLCAGYLQPWTTGLGVAGLRQEEPYGGGQFVGRIIQRRLRRCGPAPTGPELRRRCQISPEPRRGASRGFGRDGHRRHHRGRATLVEANAIATSYQRWQRLGSSQALGGFSRRRRLAYSAIYGPSDQSGAIPL